MQLNFIRMKRHLLCFITITLAVFITEKGFTQQIDSMISVYAEQYPIEKMHIHFDKKIYNHEETIWYKVYILSGNGLSSLSKNVYVEWYDTTGKMIKQTVAPLRQSTAKGSFELPADYKGNFIHLKAYTRWMLNDDPAFAYEKELIINNGPSPTLSKPVVFKTKVETFPEGGFLIKGLTSRVAFKATNQFGNPVFFKGFLVNDKEKTIDTLRVKHDGMGSFVLTPNPLESYHLSWTDENGKIGITPIIITKTDGVLLSVTTTNEKALVKVERSKNISENLKKMTLLVHMNQNLLYTVRLNASEKLTLTADVPIDELPTGILQFSLFSEDWIPLAERIIFVNNRQHEFNTKLTTGLVSLSKRGKNVYEIYITDTASANMSVSITDATVVTPDENTIFSDLLLSNEIKGKIYNPGYYLTSDADSITANLDLVMLTNGWRRFDWEKIKAGITPILKYPQENSYMKITGKVLGMKSISTSNPLILNLIIEGKDSSKSFSFLPIAKDGKFEHQGSFFYDTVRLYYSFNGKDRLTDITQVQFDNGLLRQAPKTIQYGEKYRPYTWNDSLAKLKMNYFLNEQEQLKRRMASATLQEVIVKSRVKSKELVLEEKYVSGLFSGGDGYSFDIANDLSSMGAQNILSYLQGRVAGLTITGAGGSMSMSWRGSTPDLFINEMQSTVDQVQTVSVNDIAFVKVFRPPFFGSMGGGAGGAIAIYTRKGGEGRKNDPNSKGLENTILGGYSRFKEFYNPSYEKASDNFETDIRTTLYWNPYIITNKNNPRARIQFYNNDISKKLQLILEGVNADGKMTRVVKLLE